MEHAKFIVSGEDKKVLAGIKNILCQSGHIFLGYSKEPVNIIRHIRSYMPDLVIIEVRNRFRSLKQILEIVDEEMLAACILLLDSRSDEVFDFLRKTKTITYMIKPIFEEVLLQIVDISLANFSRIQDYEQMVKKLNDTLESRKFVEKAKWILIEQQGLTEEEAYEVIRKKSRDNRLPMREIAEAIILTRGIGRGKD